jgi:hypothetical protein
MTQISSMCKPAWLPPRTADYVATLMRDGDDFDYRKWLQQAQGKGAQGVQRPTITSGQIASAELAPPLSILRRRKASPLFTRRQPIVRGIDRSHRDLLGSTSTAPIAQRLRKVHEAWNDFQGNRTRDAVYGYLQAVFAIVAHYRVRRRTKKLLRHAFKFADIPLDKSADPFTAIIRCTSGGADCKAISKWARALRYVARCKVPPTRLKTFMKEVGGVNACADRYAAEAAAT